MGKAVTTCAVIAALVFLAATSRSDVTPAVPTLPSDPTPTVASPEPISGTAVAPAPGSETPPRDPFSPYAIGPAPNDTSRKPFWNRADLSADEQAVVDQGVDTTAWNGVHDAFNQAVRERSQQAGADSAAAQLGVDSLAGTGVVP
jgi:hypothetical protein